MAHWNIDVTWLWLKRFAANCGSYVLGFAMILVFGVAAIQIGADALHWLKEGTWGTGRTIAEVWPSAAGYVTAIEWVGIQRMAAWVVGQEMTWAYVALGLVCLWVFMFLSEVREYLDAEWEGRHSNDD